MGTVVHAEKTAGAQGTIVVEESIAGAAGSVAIAQTTTGTLGTIVHAEMTAGTMGTLNALPLVPAIGACTAATPGSLAFTANADIVVATSGSSSDATRVALDTMTFVYKPERNDEAKKLDYKAETSLALNGGTIMRASSTPSQPAVLTLPYIGASGSRKICSACSMGASHAIAIDGRDEPKPLDRWRCRRTTRCVPRLCLEWDFRRG
jgi:hypothetical protein